MSHEALNNKIQEHISNTTPRVQTASEDEKSRPACADPILSTSGIIQDKRSVNRFAWQQ